MPIDFSEDDVPKRKLESCRIHNLKFDPAITWGCVLCKKGQQKRISWMLVVGAILVVAALAFLLVPMFTKEKVEFQAPCVRRNTVAGADSAQSDMGSSADKCLIDKSTEVEKCLAATASTAGQIDREICLSALQSLETECAGAYSKEIGLETPLYSLGTLPEWPKVRAPLEQNQKLIEQCLDSQAYRFGMRISVDPQTGAVASSIATTFGLAASGRQCVYDAISKLVFPTTNAAEPYTFTAFIDSEVLSLNRPAEIDESQAAYEKFVKEKRDEAASADRREEIKEQAAERESRYRESLANPKPE